MRSKKQKMMRLTSLTATARLKNILMRDFSEALSSRIIEQNLHKHGLTSYSFNNGGKSKVVNSIVSDYKAINPLGSASVERLKNELRLTIK